MTLSRRREIVLLCLVAVVTALGMSLVSAAVGDSALRATRGITLVAALLIVVLLMDLGGRSRDHTLLPITAMICGVGLIILWRLDPFRASKQVIWMVMGAGLMLATYLLVSDIRVLARYKYLAGAGAVALLVSTMIWGQAHFGARLWLDFGFVSVQPSELAKILMAVFLAGYMADRGPIIGEVGKDRWGLPLVELRYLGPIGLMVAFCLAIFITQRDLGAAVLFLGLAVAILYLGTGRRTYVLLGLIAFVGGAVLASLMFVHVHRRMVGWLNPWGDPLDAGMQALQAMYALGEGGLLGTGLGLGMPFKMPAVETDLIFAAVGEELGLAGSCGLLALFAMVVFSGFSIAWRCRDRFGMLLAAGLTAVFGLQALVIVGGVIRVVPLTGITLPFVSYGGTSILVNFIALGLLLCISRDCCGPETGAAERHA
jgi:cell division protein FtsW (lipid II flippase)